MKPFLKWPGGKRWLVQSYPEMLSIEFRRYFEPFLGSGAVFFHLTPHDALISDSNKDVIEAYRVLRNSWRELERALLKHHSRHSDEYFYRLRSKIPDTTVERAARLIYLNRTCFNGIYRVNLKGEFNVPRGTKNAVILPDDDFAAYAKVLKRAEIIHSDFEAVIDRSAYGDLVFADPPYTVRHNNNGFIKYNERLFSWRDQERLAQCLTRAKDRGVNVVITNANHHSVRELYADHGFDFMELSRFSSISGLASSRKSYEELVALKVHTEGRKVTCRRLKH